MFAALGTRESEAIEVARAIGGTAFVANDRQREPTFGALVIGTDREAVGSVADIGLYRVDVRPMRHQRRFWPPGDPSPGVTAAFAMLRHPGLSHEQADAHWRDTHAPLALRHHPGMWHYHQVSIDEVLDGRFYDGVALCAFASEQDLAERFFGGHPRRRGKVRRHDELAAAGSHDRVAIRRGVTSARSASRDTVTARAIG